NVDDLEHVVAEHTMERSRELEQCRVIIADEADHFLKGFKGYAAAPLIAELRRKAEEAKEAELRRLFSRLPDLPPEARDELTAYSNRLLNKLLHPQIHGIKEQAAHGNGDSLRLIAEALGVEAAQESAAESADEEPPTEASTIEAPSKEQP
ncbi:MAG: hypothetical protein KDB90_07495, partial [Planctomycetes bacterium]|nr:hypothetical protein [Planctomycetota bacterium]